MTKIPNELRRYLEAVKEANERIVETKRRQMNPDLTDDDLPWLFAESDQVGMHLRGFSEELGEKQVEALSSRLMIEQGDYKTWDEVLSAAEKMNAEIGKVLDG